MTTTLVETKEQKRIRLAAAGYLQAIRPGRCCLCGKGIGEGQYIGKMPDGWQVRCRQRWSHRKCREALVARIRAKAEAVR